MNILKVSNLTKPYDNKSGVFGLDLSIDSGDIVLVLGPNGAGKTTAFQSILNLISSQYAELSVFSKPFDRIESLKVIGAMISKPVFYEYLTGKEHLTLMSGLYPNVTDQNVEETLRAVGLASAKNKKVSQYSSGMKQRLDLARAIVHKPGLLFLDEPFNGMDIEAKHEIKNLLLQLQNENQMGIVISSHIIWVEFQQRLLLYHCFFKMIVMKDDAGWGEGDIEMLVDHLLVAQVGALGLGNRLAIVDQHPHRTLVAPDTENFQQGVGVGQ